MKIFIDSADIGEIREAASMGLVDGVTTNPSLLAKAGKPAKKTIVEICEMVDGPVSAEVLSTQAEQIVNEGRALATLHKNVVVKVPLTIDGLKATRALKAESIPSNVTLCFSASQGILAAKAGARFISPFVGRIDDTSDDGMRLIEQLVTIYKHYGVETEVLVASVRHPLHFVQAALLGAQVATLPLSVIQKLAMHPLTDLGLARFLKDAERIPKD